MVYYHVVRRLSDGHHVLLEGEDAEHVDKSVNTVVFSTNEEMAAKTVAQLLEMARMEMNRRRKGYNEVIMNAKRYDLIRQLKSAMWNEKYRNRRKAFRRLPADTVEQHNSDVQTTSCEDTAMDIVFVPTWPPAVVSIDEDMEVVDQQVDSTSNIQHSSVPQGESRDAGEAEAEFDEEMETVDNLLAKMHRRTAADTSSVASQAPPIATEADGTRESKQNDGRPIEFNRKRWNDLNDLRRDAHLADIELPSDVRVDELYKAILQAPKEGLHMRNSDVFQLISELQVLTNEDETNWRLRLEYIRLQVDRVAPIEERHLKRRWNQILEGLGLSKENDSNDNGSQSHSLCALDFDYL